MPSRPADARGIGDRLRKPASDVARERCAIPLVSWAFRFLPALIIVAYFGHRAYYFRKVRHASGTVVLQPPEPAAALGLCLAVLTLAANAVYVAAPQRMGWTSWPLQGWIRVLDQPVRHLMDALLQRQPTPSRDQGAPSRRIRG